MERTNNMEESRSGGRGARRRVAAVALVGVFVLLLTGCFGDGTYGVGYGPGQLRPGATYSTAGGQGCHWVEWVWDNIPYVALVRAWDERTSAAERQIHTISAGLSGAFSSDGCGIWEPVTPRTPPFSPPTAGKPAGMWRVPTDMAHGTWSAPGGSGCYWARLENFQEPYGNNVISQHRGGGRQTIHVGRSVHGFESTGYGTWHKIG